MTRQDIEAEIRRQAERLLSQQRTPKAVKIGRIQTEVLTRAGVTGTVTVPVRTPSSRLPLVLALGPVDLAGCLRVVDAEGATAYESLAAPR